MTKTKEKVTEFNTPNGIIRIYASKQTDTSAFTPVEGWRLLRAYQAKAKLPAREELLVYEEWVHPSKSGIVFVSTIDQKTGEVYYTIEGYGIGTISPKDFSELTDMAPIQYTKANNITDARNALAKLMQENAALAKAY